MLLWIPMDIVDEVQQIRFRHDGNSSKRVLKETAGASIHLVDCLGVGVEEVGEGLAGRRAGFRPQGLWLVHFLLRFDADEQVKMIFQQAIGIGVGNRCNVFYVLVQKVTMVVCADKDVFAIVATRENMVRDAMLERWWFGHGS